MAFVCIKREPSSRSSALYCITRNERRHVYVFLIRPWFDMQHCVIIFVAKNPSRVLPCESARLRQRFISSRHQTSPKAAWVHLAGLMCLFTRLNMRDRQWEHDSCQQSLVSQTSQTPSCGVSSRGINLKEWTYRILAYLSKTADWFFFWVSAWKVKFLWKPSGVFAIERGMNACRHSACSDPSTRFCWA